MTEASLVGENPPNEGENVIKQLENFDFNGSVQMKVIFEDSDEDTNIIEESKQEITDKTPDTVKESDDTVDPRGTPAGSNDEEHDKHAKKTSYINESTILNNKEYNDSCQKPDINVEELISQAIIRVKEMYDTSECNNNIKRKIVVEDVCPNKSRKSTVSNTDSVMNNNNTNIHVEQNVQGRSTLQDLLDYVTNNSAVPKNFNTNREKTPETLNTNMANPFIQNLLKSVARSLILVIKAHNILRHTEKNPSPQREIEEKRKKFLNIRNYFFHMSYMTVNCVIIPCLADEEFVKSFFRDAIKLSHEMKQQISYETQLRPIFYELIEWTKRKMLNLSGNPVLDFILKSPPNLINENTDESPLINSVNARSVDNSRQSASTQRLRNCQNYPLLIHNLNSSGNYSQSPQGNDQTHGVNLLQTQENLITRSPENNVRTFIEMPRSHPHTSSGYSWQNHTTTTNATNYPNLQAVYPNLQANYPNLQANAESRQQLQLAQVHQQNAEITRSLSTDSGFVSPLNFANDIMINGNGENQAKSAAAPIITHITSLNPQANYIKEGSCHVCGKTTHLMCISCYAKYYCSIECQRADWKYHYGLCITLRDSAGKR